jgi:hypothetical protein
VGRAPQADNKERADHEEESVLKQLSQPSIPGEKVR